MDKETRALLQERLAPLQNTIAGLNLQLAELQKRLAGYEQDRRESTNKPLQTGITSKLDVAYLCDVNDGFTFFESSEGFSVRKRPK